MSDVSEQCAAGAEAFKGDSKEKARQGGETMRPMWPKQEDCLAPSLQRRILDIRTSLETLTEQVLWDGEAGSQYMYTTFLRSFLKGNRTEASHGKE